MHLQDCGQSFVCSWSILHVPSKKRDEENRIEHDRTAFHQFCLFFVLPVQRWPFWHSWLCFAGRTIFLSVHQQYRLHKGTAFPGAVSLTRWIYYDFLFHPQLSRLQDKSNYRYPVVIWPSNPSIIFNYMIILSTGRFSLWPCFVAMSAAGYIELAGFIFVYSDIVFPCNCPPLFLGGACSTAIRRGQILRLQKHRAAEETCCLGKACGPKILGMCDFAMFHHGNFAKPRCIQLWQSQIATVLGIEMIWPKNILPEISTNQTNDDIFGMHWNPSHKHTNI